MKRLSFWIGSLSICLIAACSSLAQDRQEIDKQLKYARAQLMDRQFDKALSGFEKTLGLDANNLEAQLGKIQALKGLKKEAELKSFAQKRAKTSQASDFIIAAQVKLMDRNVKGAEADLKQALKMDAKSYLAQYMMGNVRRQQKNPDGAIDFYLDAIKSNEDYPEPYFQLGDIHFRQGNSGKAVSYWKEYLKRIPETGKRYQYVSSQLKKLGGL